MIQSSSSYAYNFYNDNGTLRSNNQNIDNSTAYSFIQIDISNLPSDKQYTLGFNATVSSENTDYGYAFVTTSEEPPDLSSTDGLIMKISGDKTDYYSLITIIQAPF